MSLSPASMVVRVFFPFAFGYFLSYLYRVVNAVIAPDLVSELGLGPDVLGLLTASYFLTFAAFQIPLGVLLDRYGPRQIEAALLVFAAVGACVFAMADSSSSLIAGRALIGFGVSACLMASFKAFTQFYSMDKLPLVNGFIMAAGGLGALAGTTPTEFAVQEIGWRGMFFGLAGLTLLCALIIYILVPSTKRPEHKTTFTEQMSGVKTVFTSRFFWAIAPVTMTTQASLISVQSLWVGPWHRDVAGLARPDVANSLFFIALAMVLGFLTLGAVSSKLAARGIPIIRVSVFGLIVFMVAQIGLILQVETLYPYLWLLFGFFGTTGILNYAILSKHFPTELAGRVNTAINLMVFITNFGFLSLTGQIIDLWPVAETGGYLPEAYQGAFGFLLMMQVAAFTWFVVGSRKTLRG